MKTVSTDGKAESSQAPGINGSLAALVCSMVLGLWGVACLVAGLFSGGGLTAAIKGWFEAVAGL